MKIKLLPVVLVVLLLAPIPKAFGQWMQLNGPGHDGILCFVENNGEVFAGTEGSGIFVSTDDGTNWSGLNSPHSSAPVFSMTSYDGIIFAGILSNVFRSTDDGLNWAIVDSGLFNGSVLSFSILNGNLYAGAYGGGVFLSADSGVTWTAANNGLTDHSVTGLAVIGKILFACTDTNGIFRSMDGGQNWAKVNTPTIPSQMITFDGNLLVLADGNLLWLSTDTGSSWSIRSQLLNDFSFAVVNRNVFAATEGGVLLSTDSGLTWNAMDSGLTNSDIGSLGISNGYLFAGPLGLNVNAFRSPLSELIGSSGVATAPQQPQTLNIYPNPISHEATISFSSGVSSPANVSIYNLLGSEVARLYGGTLDAGNHSFTWDASGAIPGSYMCVVKMDGQVLPVPVVVAK
jgi:photosystem II stability/assembly factor-like uncharacterized protein